MSFWINVGLGALNAYGASAGTSLAPISAALAVICIAFAIVELWLEGAI